MDGFVITIEEINSKIRISLIDKETKTKTEILEPNEDDPFKGFSAFDLARFMINHFAPKYREIVRATLKS